MVLSNAGALGAWKDHPICLRDSMAPLAMPQPRSASRLIFQQGHPVLSMHIPGQDLCRKQPPVPGCRMAGHLPELPSQE